MKKFAQKMTRQGFVVLASTMFPVLLSLLCFAFSMSDATAIEIYVKYTKMVEYILSAILLSIGGAMLTDYIFRSSK